MFTQNEGLYIAHSAKGPISITGKMVNRHGLIAGATGSGKPARPSHYKFLLKVSARQAYHASWRT